MELVQALFVGRTICAQAAMLTLVRFREGPRTVQALDHPATGSAKWSGPFIRKQSMPGRALARPVDRVRA